MHATKKHQTKSALLDRNRLQIVTE